MYSNFEEYFLAVKNRRTEDNYDYTDADLEKYRYYFEDCWKSELSPYKSLEFLWFEINGLAL